MPEDFRLVDLITNKFEKPSRTNPERSKSDSALVVKPKIDQSKPNSGILCTLRLKSRNLSPSGGAVSSETNTEVKLETKAEVKLETKAEVKFKRYPYESICDTKLAEYSYKKYEYLKRSISRQKLYMIDLIQLVTEEEKKMEIDYEKEFKKMFSNEPYKEGKSEIDATNGIFELYNRCDYKERYVNYATQQKFIKEPNNFEEELLGNKIFDVLKAIADLQNSKEEKFSKKEEEAFKEGSFEYEKVKSQKGHFN